MEQIKEIKISYSEEVRGPSGGPRVEINGEKLRGVTNLKVKYNQDDSIDNPFDNGFLVEYISEENGQYLKRTIGQSFRVGKQQVSRLLSAGNRK